MISDEHAKEGKAICQQFFIKFPVVKRIMELEGAE